jgi:hypothetical protein
MDAELGGPLVHSVAQGSLPQEVDIGVRESVPQAAMVFLIGDARRQYRW